eukprot:TRINITY_DN8206_c0_g1_i2.p1 TRINITY_DN8206_c0_g1~~TRINITY_DN8206_c0_g1_i2.p1  ORF type:complete len:551 (-),score=48.45 TRINITY_DN8206_c0_g1_i2:314-1966(-)
MTWKVDVCILLSTFLILLFSLRDDFQYRVVESWFLSFDVSQYKNGHTPSQTEKLPKPLITDVDGDHLNELVYLTTDYKLIIAQPTDESIVVKRQATLLPKLLVTSGRWPITLGSGYIVPSEGEPRQQIIVVLVDGGILMAFSSTLKLLWETSLLDSIPKDHAYREAAITILTTSLIKGDRGAVVVAFRLVEHHTMNHRHDVDAPDNVAKETEIDHVRYFGLDGRTGAIRWRHSGDAEFGLMDNDAESDSGKHSYQLHLLKHLHLGELDWHTFRDDILHHLPHRWHTRSDSKLIVDHFERNKKLGGVSQSRWTLEDVGIPVRHVGLSDWEEGGHSEAEHVDKPNVLVSHLKEGIEVIHLYTGRTLASLSLTGDLSHDINGDGAVDHLVLQHSSERGWCEAMATSGIPPIEMLYNVSLCHSSPMFANLFAQSMSITKDVTATNPIILHSFHAGTSLLNPSKERDFIAVFLVSTGIFDSSLPQIRDDDLCGKPGPPCLESRHWSEVDLSSRVGVSCISDTFCSRSRPGQACNDCHRRSIHGPCLSNRTTAGLF